MAPTNSYDLLDPKPETNLFSNLRALFQALADYQATHPGVVFERADDPRSRILGFWDATSKTSWHIRCAYVFYGNDGERKDAYAWRGLFKSAESRDDLASQLTHGRYPRGSTISG